MKYFTYSHLFLIHLSLFYELRVASWENERMRRERRKDEVRDEIIKDERIRWENVRMRDER